MPLEIASDAKRYPLRHMSPVRVVPTRHRRELGEDGRLACAGEPLRAIPPLE